MKKKELTEKLKSQFREAAKAKVAENDPDDLVETITDCWSRIATTAVLLNHAAEQVRESEKGKLVVGRLVETGEVNHWAIIPVEVGSVDFGKGVMLKLLEQAQPGERFALFRVVEETA